MYYQSMYAMKRTGYIVVLMGALSLASCNGPANERAEEQDDRVEEMEDRAEERADELEDLDEDTDTSAVIQDM